jgi:hypothetical protein
MKKPKLDMLMFILGGKLYKHHLGRAWWLDTVRRETDVSYVPRSVGDVSHTRTWLLLSFFVLLISRYPLV